MNKLQYTTETKKFSELKDIIDSPRFQRGLVWSKEKKKEFIKTLKAGLPIGVLLLSKTGDRYLVIDGLQRFTTMKEYARDYFTYVDRDEITDTDIVPVIAASQKASQFYDNSKDSDKARIRADVRTEIVQSIQNGQNLDLLVISQNAATSICKKVPEFDSQDDHSILNSIYKIVSKFDQNASIDDVEIPLIIFHGSEEALASVFQKLNQEGVKLSKYDVFAATWIEHYVKVKNDPDFIDLVVKKYEAAQAESGLDIYNYDPDELRQNGTLTVFEYAFALGKAIMNTCKNLYPYKSDSKVDSIGFLLLAELMDVTYQKMGDLANTIDKYSGLDFKKLKDAIVECAKTVENSLGTYILSPKKKASLVCHSDLQLASYIIVIFKLRYSLTVDGGLIPISNGSKKVNEVKRYLYKHYLYDILRGYWSGSGDSKLENIIAEPETCRYMRDVDRGSFEQAVHDWIELANRKAELKNVSAETKLFLNYLLRDRVHDVDKMDYDIEHCVPKKVIQNYYLNKKIIVPMSSVCNLVYIPSTDNRSKGDLTYYQRQDKAPDTFTLNEEQLERLAYPTRGELRFVESVDTITEEKYMEFLRERAKYIQNCIIQGLYHE